MRYSRWIVLASAIVYALITYVALMLIVHAEDVSAGTLAGFDPALILRDIPAAHRGSFLLWLAAVLVAAEWRYRLREGWRRQSMLFSRTLETVADGIYVVDISGKITMANSAAERILRLPREEITRRTYDDPAWKIASPEGQPFPADRQPFVRVTQTRQPVYGVEQVFRQPDGSEVIVSINAAPLLDSGGDVIGEVGSLRDITERKRADEEKTRQTAQLREQADLLDLSRDSIFVRDLDNRIRFMNRGAEELYGWAKSEALGRRMQELLQTQFPEPLADIEAQILQTGQWQGELIHTARDGHRIAVASQWALQRDRNGNPTAILQTNTNISLRREAENALRHSLQTQQALLDAIPDTMLRLSRDGRILDYKPGKGIDSELPNSQLVSRDIRDLLPDAIATRVMEAGTRALQTHQMQSFEFSLEVREQARDFESRIFRSGEDEILAIIRDITERKAADRLKHEFISTVSHELRTPLTSIRGSLGLVAGGVAGPIPEPAMRLVEIASKNSQRLVRLINDLLDFERIESGKMVFRFQALDLESVVSQAIEDNRAYAEELGVGLIFAQSLPDVKVNGDSDRLIQVMTNLLSNAVKFSSQGAVVEISLSRRESMVRVAVCDHGPGVPEAFRDRIFQRFSQADPSDARRQGGTGLGLSISRSIVEKHGGAIGFETTSGCGATFYFDLPILEHGAVATSGRMSSAIAPRLIVVEHDDEAARMISAAVAPCGAVVDVARDADQMWQQLADRRYASMLLDLDLPGQDAITLLQELRSREHTRKMPVIVLSGQVRSGRVDVKRDALQYVEWLDKPVDHARLTAAFQRTLMQDRDHTLRILHVEDDPDVLQVVRAVLSEIGEVEEAGNLALARERLDASPYDLVILDLSLPDGPGLELLPLLERQQPGVPVVIFTAHDVGKETARQASAVLLKSSTSNERLRETILSLIEPRR